MCLNADRLLKLVSPERSLDAVPMAVHESQNIIGVVLLRTGPRRRGRRASRRNQQYLNFSTSSTISLDA